MWFTGFEISEIKIDCLFKYSTKKNRKITVKEKAPSGDSPARVFFMMIYNYINNKKDVKNNF
ncbi:MAG: hypothetical protein COY04_00400 [Parcubacteria group bacterium CG_4_10_14_0_2_um_filter_7_35_8]|nr:MAG: hypothetical protein COU70_00550 [Parcubacteria group bacterium CG10_big_fil_rev_8_21_14_0_10_35_15]PIZ77148.1 MAG: hypothetical protein COY04_00400 [Parcubacteria group bacterium CG_4_10_14_0_2_um_filter_7_35_8]